MDSASRQNDEAAGIVERVMLASARALLAAGGSAADAFPDPADIGMAARVRVLVRGLPRDRRWLLALGCRAIDGLARVRGLKGFERMDVSRARALLDGLQASRGALLRRTAAVVRMLALYAYFSCEDSWAATGYDGPWLGRLEIETLAAPRLEREQDAV